MVVQTSPCGSWASPITTDLIVAGGVSLSQLSIDGEDIYWVEGRPQEAGRSVLVRRTPNGQTFDVTPPPYNVRTRAHEYGGVSYLVQDGVVYFSNFTDQHVYRIDVHSAGEPERITSEENMRYADLILDKARNRLIGVREDHADATHEPINALVAIPLPASASDASPVAAILAAGHDFYSSVQLSPDGSHVAYLTWDHPNMPWDGTELWVAEIASDGSLTNAKRVAGSKSESIFQPQWSPDGVLCFVSDKTGWWNLYRLTSDGHVEALCKVEAEFGVPQWVFGMSTYGFAGPNEIVCLYTKEGFWHLARLNTALNTLVPQETPFTDFSGIRVSARKAICLVGSPTFPASIARFDFEVDGASRHDILKQSTQITVDEGYLSKPESIAFPTAGGKTAFAIYYPPKNKDYLAPSGEKPPLIVKSHGGPTSSTNAVFNLSIQFWTSRGIAVLDVNYGGSTGYGREYRDRLKDNWGIVDVEDCSNGAKFLVERGDVDGNKLAIRGGSAGGYTTLAALAFTDTFKAGASYYGVSDLELLARDTHKFESRYLDGLVGPYPDRKDLYMERAPIHHTDSLNCPVIFFQGLDDKVVPPNQAEVMVERLRAKGVPVAYVTYEGEGHGFRRAENIKHSMEAELYFYSRVFGFEPAGDIVQVPIENL